MVPLRLYPHPPPLHALTTSLSPPRKRGGGAAGGSRRGAPAGLHAQVAHVSGVARALRDGPVTRAERAQLRRDMARLSKRGARLVRAVVKRGGGGDVVRLDLLPDALVREMQVVVMVEDGLVMGADGPAR